MIKRRRLRTIFLAAAVTAMGIARTAQSGLYIDLRVTSVSGPAAANNSLSVLITGPGARIDFEIWGRVDSGNTNPFDDGVIRVDGSLVSRGGNWQDPGQIAGTLAAQRDARFKGPSSWDGVQTDLDSDGDLDVGSNNQISEAGFFSARSNNYPQTVISSSVRIGHASFTIERITSAPSEVILQFLPRQHPAAAQWQEDGIIKLSEQNGAVEMGQVITVSALVIPEPLGLLNAVSTFAAALRPQRRR